MNCPECGYSAPRNRRLCWLCYETQRDQGRAHLRRALKRFPEIFADHKLRFGAYANDRYARGPSKKILDHLKYTI